MTSKTVILVNAALGLIFLSGCSHQVVLDDSHHYPINESLRSEPVVAVISEQEINRKDSIRAFSTGIANSWDAEPGVMLEQVTQIEMPQMFETFTLSRTPMNDPEAFHLLLAVPDYEFSNHHARITVDAQLLSPGHETLLEKSYSGSGPSGGGRMWGAGAFGMKSAMRRSSVGALKDIFEHLRSDLRAVLDAFAESDSGREVP